MQGIPSQEEDNFLNTLIERWIATKYQKTNSVRTRDTYLETIYRVRTFLQEHGEDLDSHPAQIVPLLEQWISAVHKAGMKAVSPATRNLRHATLSSFYRFAILQGYLALNPLDRIERATAVEPRRARPLASTVLERRLAAIDRTTALGRRDFALIVVAVTTGRRAAELAGMRLGHFTPTPEGILIRWPRLKGGKTDETLLEYPMATTLLAHLISQEGPDWPQMPGELPVWRVQSAHGLGDPLGYKGIQEVYRRHLGVTTVHSTRHAFATALKQLGMPLTEIQRLLKHSSLAVTQRYLEKELPSPINPMSQELGRYFGLNHLVSEEGEEAK